MVASAAAWLMEDGGTAMANVGAGSGADMRMRRVGIN